MQPAFDVVDLMEYEVCCHELLLPRRTACLMSSNTAAARGLDAGPEVEYLLGRRKGVLEVDPVNVAHLLLSPPSELALTAPSGSFVELDPQRAGVHTGISHPLAQFRIFHERVGLLRATELMHHQNLVRVALSAVDGLLGHPSLPLHVADAVVDPTPSFIVRDTVADEQDRHSRLLEYLVSRAPLVLSW
jgi:hypothetical protein